MKVYLDDQQTPRQLLERASRWQLGVAARREGVRGSVRLGEPQGVTVR